MKEQKDKKSDQWNGVQKDFQGFKFVFLNFSPAKPPSANCEKAISTGVGMSQRQIKLEKTHGSFTEAKFGKFCR